MRLASRHDRPSRSPWQNWVDARSGVSSVTAAKLATAPAAAAIPNVRTASIRAAASDANPTAVTMLVRPHAVPTRRMALLEAIIWWVPRRTLRLISSMKWMESHVPTTRASDGTTLVRRLMGAPKSPRIPMAQTAPTAGGMQATTVERRLRASVAERIKASVSPSELKISMSCRRAKAA